MNDQKNREGGCLCGAIRYAISGDPIWTEYCHCRMCQKSTGAMAAVFMDVHPDQLTWLAKEPTEFSSSEDVLRGFCPICGSSLSFRNSRFPELIGLTVATLDDPNSVTPDIHIFTESQAPWLKIDDTCKKFLKWPDKEWIEHISNQK